jgi:hypothetical protein
MNRGRWIWDTAQGKLVPAHEYRRAPAARSELAAPMLIRDFQEPVKSMADGQYYTSKRHWRDHLKAHGMIELGNDMPEGKAPEPVFTPGAIAEAYDQLEAGYRPAVKESPPEPWEGPIEESADNGS